MPPSPASLFEVFRIQAGKFRQSEDAVFSYEPAVEVYFSAAVFRTLYHHQIPVDCRLVAIEGIFVGCARCQMEAACNLFIEEGVLHRIKEVRVDSDVEIA